MPLTTVIDDLTGSAAQLNRFVVATPEPPNDEYGGQANHYIDLPAIGVGVRSAAPKLHEALRVPAITARVHLPAAHPSRPAPEIPPVLLAVQTRTLNIGVIEPLPVPPIQLNVVVLDPDTVSPPRPARVGVTIPTPMLVDAAIIRTQPEDGETLGTNYPEFIVAVDQRDLTKTYTVELQYYGTDGPDTAVTLSQDVDPIVGGAYITPTVAFPDIGIWFWRVRLLLDGVEQIGWTQPWSFTVDTVIQPAYLEVDWTVNPAAPREIHLWHFDPPGPDVGDTVTAYGQGFPLTPGRITCADIPLDIVSWTLVPAVADPAVIDGDTVDPEHFEVVFTAPNIDGGGPFVVEAS